MKPDAGAKTLTAKERADVVRELNAGRKLSQAKDWAGAMKAFDRALAIAPNDVHALSELGWAAFQANDLGKAETANRRALANAKTPAVRAPILYNTGRVAEARGDKAAASKAYRDSLANRDNDIVQKRLASLGGDAGADALAALPCSNGSANTNELCTCLKGVKDYAFPEDAKRVCEPSPSQISLGDSRLAVVVWGAEMLGEKPHFLTVQEGNRVRSVANLGTDYEPGAFGVHNEAQVKGGEAKKVNGHDVVVVRSEQHDTDMNQAGLEACTHTEKRETVCALGTAVGSSKCTAPIPVSVDDGCDVGVTPDPADMDDDTKAAIAEIKKSAHSSHAKTKWTLSDTGVVTVTLAEGSKDLIDASVLKPAKLWP